MTPALVIAADIGGWDGYHAGDEAMFGANVAALRRLRPDVHLTAISRDPAWTEREYGVRAILPMAPDPSPDLIEALTTADALFISGAGNLCSKWPGMVQDRSALINLAADLGKPALVLGQTLGPDFTPEDRARLSQALSRVALLGLRGDASMQLAGALGVPATRLIAQVDDAWSLDARPSAAARDVAARLRAPWIAVTLAPLAGVPGDGLAAMRALAEQLGALARELDAGLVFLPHWHPPPGIESDGVVARRLMGLLDPAVPVTIAPVLTGTDTCWLTRQAALVVATRYHPIVFGASRGVPCVAVHADEHTRVRHRECLLQVGLEDRALPLTAALDGGLLEAGRRAWRERDLWRDHVAQRSSALSEGEAAKWTRVAAALGWPRPRRPFVRPSLDVSAVVLTRDGAPRLAACLQSIQDAGIARELVVFVDDATTDDSAAIARRFTPSVHHLATHGYIEFSLARMVAACRGRYILRLDDDETLGGAWDSPIGDVDDLDRYTHMLVPRRWLVPGRDMFLSGGDWFPDLQLRLFRNDPQCLRWPTAVHQPLAVEGQGVILWDRWIDHHVLWQQSRAQREAKCADYRRVRPDLDLAHFYLWEERPVRLAPLDAPGSWTAVPLARDAVIRFGTSGNAAPYTLDGWSHPEPWGAWTDGPRAALRLPLREPATGDVQVQFDANAYIRPGHPSLTLVLACGDQEVGRWTITVEDVTTYRCTIPAAVAGGRGVLILSFGIAHPASPRQLGESTDDRRLGVGLHRLGLWS